MRYKTTFLNKCCLLSGGILGKTGEDLMGKPQPAAEEGKEGRRPQKACAKGFLCRKGKTILPFWQFM